MEIRIQAKCPKCEAWANVDQTTMRIEYHETKIGWDHGDYVGGKWETKWVYKDSECDGTGEPVKLSLREILVAE